jgi:predicted DNA binding CopG/RHH family protein
MSEVDGRIGDLARIAIDRVGQLEQRVNELEEENESLWFMLDEMKESQKFTKEHSEELQRQINQRITELKLMQMRKADA